MLKFPNGKVNLGLSVESKRQDGFHDVSTLLLPVKLADILEVIPANDDRLEIRITGSEIPGNPSDNLVVKAYNLLNEDFKVPPVKIHLHKIIPTGAGLGGGSSDGAAMLKLCNRMFSLGLSDEELQGYARKLGSDCAFFIQNTPALATGKGDQLEPVSIDLGSYHLVLVKPEIHISTADAYSWIMPAKNVKPLRAILDQPVALWRDMLKNDFEKPVFERYPVIRKIRDQLYDLGAVYASMTGTGAAVYGLFLQDFNVRDQFPGFFSWSGKAG